MKEERTLTKEEQKILEDNGCSYPWSAFALLRLLRTINSSRDAIARLSDDCTKADILEACRKSNGSCWCGVHISSINHFEPSDRDKLHELIRDLKKYRGNRIKFKSMIVRSMRYIPLSEEDLAKMTGANRTTIKRWRSGASKPTKYTCEAIYDVLLKKARENFIKEYYEEEETITCFSPEVGYWFSVPKWLIDTK